MDEQVDRSNRVNAMGTPLLISLGAVMLVLAWGGFCNCSAGIIRHDRRAEAYQQLGKAEDFPCVREVVPDRGPDDPWKDRSSAVLITPRWVLTASHVTAKGLERQRYMFGGQEYRAVRCVKRPGPKAKAAGQGAALAGIAAGADLALVQLDRPVRHVRPAERYRGDAEVGRTITKVGYGCIGDGLAGIKLPPT